MRAWHADAAKPDTNAKTPVKHIMQMIKRKQPQTQSQKQKEINDCQTLVAALPDCQ
jgi:hypothetical protein